MAVLVPPAPSAFSNSLLVILPSPLASICEYKSCNACEGSSEAVDVAPDWLCAAISALMVCGEICAPPPVIGVVELAASAIPAIGSNDVPLWPAGEDDDDGVEANDCRPSRSLCRLSRLMAKAQTASGLT